MDKSVDQLKTYIDATLLIPVTAIAKLSWTNCTKPTQSRTNPTRRRSAKASRNWKNIFVEDNNAVFNLWCRLCGAYEHKAFIDGLQYGAHLLMELKE